MSRFLYFGHLWAEVFVKYRPYLLNSPACLPPCSAVEANVNFDEFYYYTQSYGATFENISTGIVEFSEWNILNPSNTQIAAIYPGKVDYFYILQELGKYSFCLTVNDENCIDRKCDYFIVAPQESNCNTNSYCNLIKNSLMDVNDIQGTTWHFTGGPNFEKICNWHDVYETPFFCEFNENQKALGMFCKSDFTQSEKVGINENLNLIDGEEYELTFKYLILSDANYELEELNVLTYKLPPVNYNSNGSYFNILKLTDLGIDEVVPNFIGDPTPCYIGEKNFNNVSYTFSYDSELMGGYFAFGGKITSGLGAVRTVLYITDVKVSRCVGTCGGEISIGIERIDDCTYELAAITENPVQDYKWEFSCEEAVHGSSIVTHSFLYPGLQDVCLIVNCDNSTTKLCEQVNIPETCFSLNCDNITTNTIPVVKCSTTEDTYIANFEFNVPKGYKPCSDNNCFIGDVNIEDHSYIIDTSDPLHDVLKFAVEIENAQIGQIFSFSLCGPNGGVLCYQYTIGSVQECTTCTLLTATANCTDTDPDDGILEYSGTFNIPLSNITGLCGVNSSQAGFSLGSPNGSNFNFTLTTNTQGNFSFETILCVIDEENTISCFKVVIQIVNDCNPENCEELPIGIIDCSSVSIEGVVLFNLSTAFYKNYIGEGFVLCNTDGIAISSGSYSLTSADYNVTPDRFAIELEFILDCNDIRAGLNEVEFELHFCNEQGVLKCLILNVPIECIDCSREGEGRSKVGSEKSFSNIKIYPNPANTDLFMNINSENLSNKSLKIYDTNGKVVLFKKELLEKNQIKIDNLPTGVYLIEVFDNLNVGFKEKLLIIR
ncbi:MAG: T9SS type A sorting domain-containing protein [Saprospiraceae bacterium]|nr:T9SS type A sorting domain-containing protein [Saprospiraceae bacterium]